MDSEKIIIYVVLGIVYYGYRYFFKNSNDQKKSPKEEETRVPNTPIEKRKETVVSKDPHAEKSIFDLLEEIKKQEKGRFQPDLGNPIETAKSLEDTDYELEPQKIVVENTNPYLYTAKESETKIEERVKKFDAEQYALVQKPHPLLAAIKNPSKVKEAFVIGEILTKRY